MGARGRDYGADSQGTDAREVYRDAVEYNMGGKRMKDLALVVIMAVFVLGFGLQAMSQEAVTTDTSTDSTVNSTVNTVVNTVITE